MPGPKLNGNRSLILLLVMPLMLVGQLGIGLGIYYKMKRIDRIEANNSKLDLYLRTNTKYISYGESAQRAYLLTGDEKYLNSYNTDLEEWNKNAEYYDTLPSSLKGKDLAEIRNLSRQRLGIMGLSIRLYTTGLRDSSIDVVKTGRGGLLMDSIRAKSTLMRGALQAEVQGERKDEDKLIYIFLLSIVSLILFSIFLAWLTYRAFSQYTESLEISVMSLERANEKLVAYNYNSYHALKTPLRNINGFLQLLEKKHTPQLDAESKEYIHFITDGVKQLADIINQMRDEFLLSKNEKESGD